MNDEINNKISYSNTFYQQLNDPQSNAKTYWSVLNIFFNGRKIPVVPALLIDGKLFLKEKNVFLKKKLTDLMNFLAVIVHLLTIIVNAKSAYFCY